jgi:hypothetical protein
VPTCYCATDVLSIGSGDPPTITYTGYNCDCTQTPGTVTEIDVQYSGKVVFPGPFPQDMPALNSPCDCTGANCMATRSLPEEQRRGPPLDSPNDLLIIPRHQILGQWNAATRLYPGRLLRLVLLGCPERHGFKIHGTAYVFNNKSQLDGMVPVIDESSLTFTYANSRHAVWIGTGEGRKVGPFYLVPPPP